MKPFRIALVGIGSHARRNILPAFKNINDVEIAAIVSSCPSSCEELGQIYDCPIVDSFTHLRKIKNIDALYTAAPNGLHFEHGQFALENGWHFIAEKSFVVNPEHWMLLKSMAKEKELMIAEAFMFCYHDQFRKMTELLAEGEIGSLQHIEAKFGTPHFTPNNIRYRPDLGGGALFDVGCYTIMAAYLLARSEPLSIESHMFYDLGYQVDTKGVAQIVFTSQVTASLAWGFGYSYVNECTLWGSDGRIKVNRAFSKPADGFFPIMIEKRTGEKKEIQVDPCNHFTRMLEDFAAISQSVERRQNKVNEMDGYQKILFKIFKNHHT